MKKILISLFVCIFSMNGNALAFSGLIYPLGTQYNPLHTQIEQNSLQEQLRQAQRPVQIHDVLPISPTPIVLPPTPSTTNSNLKNCSNGVFLSDGTCISDQNAEGLKKVYNLQCQKYFGEDYLWTGKYKTTGGLICDSDISVVPTTENEKSCSNIDPNSKFSKKNTEEGWIDCVCKTGYFHKNPNELCIPIKTVGSISPITSSIPQKKIGWFRRFINWLK